MSRTAMCKDTVIRLIDTGEVYSVREAAALSREF